MMGNMSSLKSSSDTWSKINQILVETKSIDSKLPLHHPHKFIPHRTLDIPTVNRRFEVQPKRKRNRIRRRKLNQTKATNHGISNVPLNSSMQIQSKIDRCTHHPSKQNRPNRNESNLMKSVASTSEDARASLNIKKTFPCGHVNEIPGHQTKCQKMILKEASCGHWGKFPCHQDRKTNKTQCNVLVFKKPFCEHNKDRITCRTSDKPSSLNQCEVVVKKRLRCGHETKVYCCQRNGKQDTCRAMVSKRMKCGHEITVSCHESSRTAKCNVEVIKTFSCDHLSFVPCHQQSCLIKVTKKLSCGHDTKLICSEKDSNIRCSLYVKFALPCGHTHSFLCPYRPKTIKCSSPIEVKLQCGHTRHIACHQNPSNIKCREFVSYDNMKVILL